MELTSEGFFFGIDRKFRMKHKDTKSTKGPSRRPRAAPAAPRPRRGLNQGTQIRMNRKSVHSDLGSLIPSGSPFVFRFPLCGEHNRVESPGQKDPPATHPAIYELHPHGTPLAR